MIDLHGRYDRVICLGCQAVSLRTDLAARLDELNPGFAESVGAVADIEIAPDADAVIETTAQFVVAACERCGGVLRRELVYLAENVPSERVARAYALVDAARALLVAGSLP